MDNEWKMGRSTQLVKKKNQKKFENMSFNEVQAIGEEYKNEIETNPKFSLEVDPLHIYNFTDQEIDFIRYMVDYKNVRYVATIMLGLDLDEGLQLYKNYNIQEEIKRINLALYARRFCSKIADLDALGGYLTTALTDENVIAADRLSGKEKLVAVRLLMELNQLKSQMITQPEVIDVMAIENDIKKLKVEDIKNLIENSDDNDKLLQKKNDLISAIDKDNLLSAEEIAYLRTQSLDELKKLKKEIERKLDNEKTISNKN